MSKKVCGTRALGLENDMSLETYLHGICGLFIVLFKECEDSAYKKRNRKAVLVLYRGNEIID